jgi:hypothetical protein
MRLANVSRQKQAGDLPAPVRQQPVTAGPALIDPIDRVGLFILPSQKLVWAKMAMRFAGCKLA